MESIFSFEVLSTVGLAILIMGGLNIDNGLVVDMQIGTLRLPPKQHMVWRSLALLISAGMRIAVLFLISKLSWLNAPQADWWFLPNRWFSHHPEGLNWFHLVLFAGGLIVIFMAFWEFYHKWKEEWRGESHEVRGSTFSVGRIAFVTAYVLFVGLLFSVDSVFTLISLLDINSQFPHMVVVVLITAVIMIFGMIPLGKLIQRSLHIKVQMLTVLAVIGAKLMVDGAGGHFSNGILTFIIAVVIFNDVMQSIMVKADEHGNTIERLKAMQKATSQRQT